MYVLPVPAPDDLRCACGDGMAHWRRFVPAPHPMVLRSETCSSVGCLGGSDRCLRVRKIGLQSLGDPELYLIPLCEACFRAAPSQPFQVKATTGFAPADPGRTCRAGAAADDRSPPGLPPFGGIPRAPGGAAEDEACPSPR